MTASVASVTEEGDHRYRVEIRGSGGTTTRAVEVPHGLARELGWGHAPEADLVRASFELLLEREPPESILRSFSLDVIGTYFPDYRSEMRRRAPGEAPGAG